MPRPAQASVSDLDHNDDGVIRIAWLSTPQQAGDIDAAEICSDLESMLKAAKPGKPVRVALVPITLTRTLMGWWYHPDAQTERTQLFSGGYDVLVLAEHDACVSDYPEFFFEGVRAINAQARTAGLRTVLAVMSKPGLSFRDKRLSAIAETVYRVGDGCNVEVIPAAFAWHETLARNRLPGTSPIRARACAYLTAAAVYVQLANERVPKGRSIPTGPRGARPRCWRARTRCRRQRARPATTAAFSGVVRIEPRIKQRLKITCPTPSPRSRQNLNSFWTPLFKLVWKTLRMVHRRLRPLCVGF